MKNRYAGSCHYGRVRFEVEAAWLIECNSSACRRKGALWHGSADANLRIHSG